MRKVLLTVMMVSSLLAFNACKKDGAQGPAGPAGPTGAAGAAGAVGPAGAKGADGTKILSKAGAPAAADGAVGDYSFDTTTKTLWGPKTATGWPATGVTLSGANGATGATGAVGATGANGTQFLAGAGVPSNAIGATGDYYFNTTNSTFYGPKLADGTWGTNVMPLGSSFSAKTYTITRGFEGTTQVTKSFGEVATSTNGAVDIFSSYAVTANDLIRINQYPGWAKNREMIFETTPGSGIFNTVPTNGNGGANSIGTGVFIVGAKFRYSNNVTNPTAEFTLTAADVARLTDAGGTAFGYLTYAEADPSTIVVGQTMNFYRTKNVNIALATAATPADPITGNQYNATYTSQTKFNLNALVPNYEKYKQDGKVFVKYKYYTANSNVAATNNVLATNANANAGWIDLTPYANSYVLPLTGPGGYQTVGTSTVNPFSLTPTAVMGSAFLGAGAITVGTDQVATPVALASSANLNGNVVINWTINSGTNLAGAATVVPFGPMTLTNPGAVLDVVTNGVRVARAFETTYYSAPSLTSNRPIAGNGDISMILKTGGQDATYFNNTKLVQLQVFVIPGDVVTALKAKGVDTNNPNAIGANIKL